MSDYHCLHASGKRGKGYEMEKCCRCDTERARVAGHEPWDTTEVCTPVLKCLIWAHQVLETHFIKDGDIAVAPGGGIPPYYLSLLVGQQVAHTTGAGEFVRWQDILVMADKDAEFQEAGARIQNAFAGA